MVPLREQIARLGSLEANWDGYQADAPHPAMLRAANDLVPFFEQLSQWTDRMKGIRVVPTRIGGVQFEWEDPDRAWEIELLPDCTIQVLETDTESNRTSERTLAVAADRPVESQLLANFPALSKPLIAVPA